MNVIEDILKHKDEEVIAFMYKTMNGVLKNYDLAIEKDHPEAVYACCLGDIALVTQILRAMKARNENKVALAKEQA